MKHLAFGQNQMGSFASVAPNPDDGDLDSNVRVSCGFPLLLLRGHR
jgi:hypothetical protein